MADEFQNWLTLNESTKIADYLKTLDKPTVQNYKNAIKPQLSQVRNQQQQNAILNYFAYLYIAERIPLENVATQIENDWRQHRAYITTALGNAQRGNFSLASFDRQALDVANAKYHRDLAAKKGKRKGPEGQAVVNIENALLDFKNNHPDLNPGNSYLPEVWKGWNWVSLGCGESKAEGSAAGHCGNAGASRGENIYSLRDGLNRVHLTFVVNLKNGILGEAKAVDNNKPADSYYPAIIALLLSGYVRGFDNSDTYLPENNFKINDLTPKIKKVVEDFLTGNEEARRPENYKPWEWLYDWNQEMVDNLGAKEKEQLLEEVLKSIVNYEPFTIHDYDYENVAKEEDHEKRWHKREDFEIPQPLKFNLNQLAIDVLEKLPLKSNLEFMERLYNLHNSIRGINKRDWTYWFQNAEVPEEDHVSDVVKSPTYDIAWETIEVYAKKALSLVNKGSTRDKEQLIDQLESIGYREIDTNEEGIGLAIELSNKFQDQIDQLTLEIIDEVVQRGRARPVEHSTISNYIQHEIFPYKSPNSVEEARANTEKHGFGWGKSTRKLENFLRADPTKDGRKIINAFNPPNQVFSKMSPVKGSTGPKTGIKTKSKPLTSYEKRFLEYVDKLHADNLDLLKRKGYSPYLGEGRFRKFLFSELKRQIVNYIETILNQQFKGMVKFDKEYVNHVEIELFTPIDILKSIRKGELSTLKEFDVALTELEVKGFENQLPKLDKWLKQNINRVVKYTNDTPHEYVKGKGQVQLQRPVVRRHHQPFREWAEIKDETNSC